MSAGDVRAGWFDAIKSLLPGDHIHHQSGLHGSAPALATFSVKREAELKRQRKAAKRAKAMK